MLEIGLDSFLCYHKCNSTFKITIEFEIIIIEF